MALLMLESSIQVSAGAVTHLVVTEKLMLPDVTWNVTVMLTFFVAEIGLTMFMERGLTKNQVFLKNLNIIENTILILKLHTEKSMQNLNSSKNYRGSNFETRVYKLDEDSENWDLVILIDSLDHPRIL